MQENWKKNCIPDSKVEFLVQKYECMIQTQIYVITHELLICFVHVLLDMYFSVHAILLLF